MNKIIHGDCLEKMKEIEDKSIDMILCDLPYGTTACKWDTIIPFEPLWKHYERIIKDNGAIILFGSEPFSSYLRLSNIKIWKYDWIWDKVQPSGIVLAKRQPMKLHEIISIFYKKQCVYNRQMTDRPKKDQRPNSIITRKKNNAIGHECFNGVKALHAKDYDYTKVNPKTIIKFQKSEKRNKKFKHPTQKPVLLCEYLIKTYTNENNLVLDNCAGSGTTGVACQNLNRNYILIEKEEKYIKMIKERLNGSFTKCYRN
jgi:site-specific DNA-methyltransferase (adenine-specific)